MKPTICYQTDEAGVFTRLETAYPFPMEGRLNVPYLAVLVEPPETPAGHLARWISPVTPMEPGYDTLGEWVIEEIPAPLPEATEDPADEESPAQA